MTARRLVAVASLAVLLASCHKGGAKGFPVTAFTNSFVAGQVLDTNGNPVPGATVQVVGSDLGSGVTDGNGVYNIRLRALPPSGEATVKVTAPGFATNQRRFQVTLDGTASLSVDIKPVEAVVETPVTTSSPTLTVTTPNQNVTVDIPTPAATLGGAGTLSVEVTTGNPKVERDVFPGDFLATDPAASTGPALGLSSIAFTEVKATNAATGQEITNLAAPATLTIKIPEGTINPATGSLFQAGDLVPIWGFEATTGLWSRGRTSAGADINGTVVTCPTGLCCVFTVPHFSWWNMDYPLVQRHCLTGRVVDGAGNPVAQASVTARGVSQNYEFGGYSDSNGFYAIDVFRGTVCTVSAVQGSRVSQTITVNVPDVQSSRSQPPSPTNVCTPLADLVLPDSACVSGVVRDTQGRALSNVTVEALGLGIWTNVDAQGRYCVEGLAVGQATTLRARATVDGSPFSTDITLTPNTTGRCSDNTCTVQDIVLDVSHAVIAGTIRDTSGGLPGVPLSGVNVSSDQGPFVMTGSDGRYCFAARKNSQVTVSVRYWNPARGCMIARTAVVAAGNVDGTCSPLTNPVTQDFDIDFVRGGVAGKVVDELGNPIPGVNVAAQDCAWGATDAQGNYAVDAPIQAGVRMYFNFYTSNGRSVQDTAFVDVTQALPVRVTLNRTLDLRLACVQGLVLAGGSPASGVQVTSPAGLVTTTDSFGNFCMDVLRGDPLTLRFYKALAGGGSLWLEQSFGTISQPGSCATGNCVDLGTINLNDPPVVTAVTAAPNPVTSRATVTLGLTATDANGDTLSYLWSAGGGTFSSATAQNPTWTAPLVGASTPFFLVVQVNDGRGGLTSGGAVVTVSPPANNRPVIASLTPGATSVLTGATTSLAVVASDPDGDPIAYTWSATGGLVVGSGANVTFQAPSVPGTYTVTVSASDGLASDTASVAIAVTAPPNRNPVIASLVASPASVRRGGSSTITVSASDPDGNPLTFAWSTTGGVLSGTGNGATLTAPGTTGPVTVDVTVTDGAGGAAAQNVVVTVVNNPPVITSLTASPTTVGGTEVATLSAAASDPDGDPITYTWTPPAQGTFAASGASASWTAPAAPAVYGFSLTVSDGALTSSPAAANVTVGNRLPVIGSIGATPSSINRGQATALVVSASDLDGDMLTYAWTQVSPAAPVGSFSAPASASTNWTAPTGPTALAVFTLRVTVADGTGNVIGNALVSVGNRAPVANAQTVNTNEDVAAAITLAGSDPDLDAFTFAIVAGPSNGALSGFSPATGAVTYTPGANFNGTDSFTFRTSDGLLDSPVVTVTVNVGAVNDAPTATPQTVNTNEDTAANITLAGTDPEGSTLTFAIASAPTSGTLTGTGANRTYTPNANFNGGDSFTFTVNDGTLPSTAATVTINVASVNDAPVITSMTATPATVASAGTSAIAVTASDVDVGDTLSYGYGVTGGSITGTGASVTYNAPASAGGQTITVTVTDGNGGSAMSNVTVTVLGDTTPPTVTTVVPANGATGVATNTTVAVTFSEVINTATVTAASFTVSGGATGPITFSGGNTIATLTPSAPLSLNTTYTVTVTTAVQDTSGNAMAALFTSTFTTINVPPPVITSLSICSGPAGAILVINGSNFDATPANNTVLVNGAAATVAAASTTSLRVAVPAGASATGFVTVTVLGQVSNTSDVFYLLTPVAPNTTLSVSKALSAVQHRTTPVVGGDGQPDSIPGAIGIANCGAVNRYLVGTGNNIFVYNASTGGQVAMLDHTTTNDEILLDIAVSADGQTAYAGVLGPLNATGIPLGFEVQVVTNVGTTPALGGRINLRALDAGVDSPISLRVTPDGTKLLVVTDSPDGDSTSGHLVIVNTATNTVTGTIQFPAFQAGEKAGGNFIAIHPTGSHAYIKVRDHQNATPFALVRTRILVYDIAAGVLVPAGAINGGASDNFESIAIHPAGVTGLLANNFSGGNPAQLTVMDFTNPAAPTLGSAFNMNLAGAVMNSGDNLGLALSPDGGVAYVMGTLSGEESSGSGVANNVVKGYDVRTPTAPVLFDECYLGTINNFPDNTLKWHFLGDRFLALNAGVADPTSVVQQDGVVHLMRFFPLGADADLAPFKGGPSGGPLSNSTLTVSCYNWLTGMPESGVNVSLSNNAGTVTANATTNLSGVATFASLTGLQNVTIAPVDGTNITVFGVNAQNVKFQVTRQAMFADEPSMTVVLSGIGASPDYASFEFSDTGEGSGGDFLTQTDNTRTQSITPNSRFTGAATDNMIGGGGGRARRSFARAAPCAHLYWNGTLANSPSNVTASGQVTLPSDLLGGFTGGNVPMAVNMMFTSEPGNSGASWTHFGFNSPGGAGPYAYSGKDFVAPIAGVGNFRLFAGLSLEGATLTGSADARVAPQQAFYDALLDLGASPAATLTNQDFTFLNAPFFTSVGGTAVTGSGGFFITDSTPIVVARDTLTPAGATGVFMVFMDQPRPAGWKSWMFFISGGDTNRVTLGSVTFTVPDLPAAVSAESFAVTNSRPIGMEILATDLGPGFNYASWELGNADDIFAPIKRRQSGAHIVCNLGSASGTLTLGPNMQAARGNFDAVALANNDVFYAGGRSGFGGPFPPLSSGEIYTNTLTPSTASTTNSMSVGRNEVVAVRLLDANDRVLMTMGSLASGLSQNADIFDPTLGILGTYTATPNSPGPGRFGHAAVRLNDGRVIVVGGISGTSPNEVCVAEIDIYDPTLNSWSSYNAGGALANGGLVARDVPRLTVLNPGGGSPTNILLTGGRLAPGPGFLVSNAALSNQACIISVPAASAPTIGAGITMTMTRHGHAAFRLVSGDVLLLGGVVSEFPPENPTALTNTVERYNAGGGNFTLETGRLILPRVQFAAAMTSVAGVTKILLAAGTHDRDGFETSDVWELYDPATGATDAFVGLVSRFDPRAVVVPRPGGGGDRILIMGGRPSDSTATNVIELFDPN